MFFLFGFLQEFLYGLGSRVPLRVLSMFVFRVPSRVPFCVSFKSSFQGLCFGFLQEFLYGFRSSLGFV